MAAKSGQRYDDYVARMQRGGCECLIGVRVQKWQRKPLFQLSRLSTNARITRRYRNRQRYVAQCAVMPAALMIGHPFSISSLWNLASASGLCSSEGNISCASAVSFFRISGSTSVARNAALSFAITSFGVPLGTQNACQNVK